MQAAFLASETSIEGRLRPCDVLVRAKLDLVVAQHPKNFHHLLIRRAHFRFCSRDDQRVGTRVAALCSARYVLTSLVPTDALGNHIVVRAVTSYSDPDSRTIR